jgi:hypothetical protein
MDLSLGHAKTYIIKRFYTGESLCDVAHFQDDIRHILLVLVLYGVTNGKFVCAILIQILVDSKQISNHK